MMGVIAMSSMVVHYSCRFTRIVEALQGPCLIPEPGNFSLFELLCFPPVRVVLSSTFQKHFSRWTEDFKLNVCEWIQ